MILERAERSLRQRIDSSAIDRSSIPLYLKAICTALAEIHRVRLVHMDIKPANVFLTERGDVRLDKGLPVDLRGAADELGSASATASASACGSPSRLSRRLPASQRGDVRREEEAARRALGRGVGPDERFVVPPPTRDLRERDVIKSERSSHDRTCKKHRTC